ncbi:MAG TPA: phytanoyl-CoA dioxygenase family protein [Cyclobacteriaceae bacterium]|nr:phytanoyl-CoA dioxygenase family protein [Cyclobacteriaceae bacterium]
MKKISRSAIITNGNITPVIVNYYIEKGFAVADSLFTKNEVQEIRDECIQIFRGNRGNVEGILPVPGGLDDFGIIRRYNAIHFPHKISETILKYVKHPKVARVLKTIVSQNVKCMQSMLFVKGPGKPGQSWHQDEYYIPTRDRSLTGAWIAIDDADVDNGCLWVIPGSQRDGFIHKIVPSESNEYNEQYSCELIPFIEDDAIPVEVKTGSVVFFNGYLLHRSLKNKTPDRSRMALVSHYMSAESMLPWNWDGRITLKEDMRDIIMITGKDPYAEKGTESITFPYLRGEQSSNGIPAGPGKNK